jgi:hypothetical protein
VFNGVFQSLIFAKDSEEPLHVFKFRGISPHFKFLPEKT